MDDKMKKLFPFGFQQLPNDRTGLASILYSAGMPGVMTGGAMGGRQFPNVYQDQFNAALATGKDPNEIMPWGKKQTPAVPAQEVVNFTPGGTRNRMRGGMMGLNYRLMR